MLRSAALGDLVVFIFCGLALEMLPPGVDPEYAGEEDEDLVVEVGLCPADVDKSDIGYDMRLIWDETLHELFGSATLGVHVFTVFDCPFGVHFLGQRARLDSTEETYPLQGQDPWRVVSDVNTEVLQNIPPAQLQLRNIPVEPERGFGRPNCVPCRPHRGLEAQNLCFGFAGMPPRAAALSGEMLLQPLVSEKKAAGQTGAGEESWCGCLSWALLQSLDLINYQGSYEEWWAACRNVAEQLPVQVQLLGPLDSDLRRELVSPLTESEKRAFGKYVQDMSRRPLIRKVMPQEACADAICQEDTAAPVCSCWSPFGDPQPTDDSVSFTAAYPVGRALSS